MRQKLTQKRCLALAGKKRGPGVEKQRGFLSETLLTTILQEVQLYKVQKVQKEARVFYPHSQILTKVGSTLVWSLVSSRQNYS